MPTKQKEVIFAFIDSQNLNLGIRSMGWKLDWRKFRIYLRDKYNVKKAYLFLGYIEKYNKLYTYLRNAGYVLIFKPIVEVKDGSYSKLKGNVDAELVLHSMIEFDNYDRAIIITGDGDFHCLVEYLSKRKKLGRLLIPNRNKYSRLLYKFKGFIDFISNLRYKVGQ